MNEVKTLLGVVLGIAALGVLAAFATPGVLADHDEPLRPPDLEYRDSNVRAAAVTGDSVTLGVETRFQHRGGPARNVTVVVQAFDEQSGLLVSRQRTDLGTVKDERDFTAVTNVTVPRDGSYELETFVLVDGRRVATGTRSVSGLESLRPDYASSSVGFRAFETRLGEIPSVTYSIANVQDGRATLDVSTYLTNMGDESASGLSLTVQARQSDSNIVADRDTVTVGGIEPGRTDTPGVTLTVPDDYNYRLDAILRKDGVVVATTTAPASLDPSADDSTGDAGNTSRENSEQDDGLQTGEFEQETDRRNGDDRTPATSGGSGPGFGVVATLVAIVLVVGLTRRVDA